MHFDLCKAIEGFSVQLIHKHFWPVLFTSEFDTILLCLFKTLFNAISMGKTYSLTERLQALQHRFNYCFGLCFQE